MIQGGGYIAVEFAGIFAGLGSHVTLVYRGENILRGFDDDVRQHLRVEMEKRGIKVMTGRTIAAIEKQGAHYSARLSTAIDARPPTASCSRPAACRTSPGSDWRKPASRSPRTAASPSTTIRAPACPSIFAVGDVTNRINLTPVAIREGHAFADTRVRRQADHGRSHQCTDRGVLRARDRRRRPHRDPGARRLAQTDIYKAMFRPLKATLSGRDTSVLMKLVVDGQTDRVVGCHVVGEGAAEMIQLVAIAVKMGATKADFDATMALHPTIAEEFVTMRQTSASYCREAAE